LTTEYKSAKEGKNMKPDFECKFDVIVAGAGIAGVAAALESARAGMKTALVEKTVLTGGLATTGMINVYLPLCDGNGTQVSFGIAEELLRASMKYGPGDIPEDWRNLVDGSEPERFRVDFSSSAYVLALDEMLVESNVDLWLDTLVAAVIMDGERVTGVEVENKSGRGRLLAECVIDATGDADVACRAGAECVEAENWLTIWALQGSLERAKTAVEKNIGTPLMDQVRLGGDNAGNGANVPPRKYRGTQGREVTNFVLNSRKLLANYYKRKHADGIDRHDLFALTIPSMAQFRTTRAVVGKQTLTDNGHARRADDSIGIVADWRKSGHVWEIPYGTLVPEKIAGFLTAGRCMSSVGDAWQVTRVIPAAAVTGQAAGAAAALSVRKNITPDKIDAREVQNVLAEKKIPLHLDDVGLGDSYA